MNTRVRNRQPTHPGIILKELYLDPRNITLDELSSATGISKEILERITCANEAITASIAVRLAAVLVVSPEMWMNCQVTYDLWNAEKELSSVSDVKVAAFINRPLKE